MAQLVRGLITKLGTTTSVDKVGTPVAGDIPVVLVQQGSERYALSATCDHAGGPLDEGTMDGDCIQCQPS